MELRPHTFGQMVFKTKYLSVINFNIEYSAVVVDVATQLHNKSPSCFVVAQTGDLIYFTPCK